MPIDTSIYQTPPPQGFNSPFQALGQLGLVQRQQQEIQSAKTLEQERQQQIAEKQKQQQSADTFNAIVGNASLTPEAVRAQIQAKAPEHLAAFDASVAKIQEAADKHNESLAHYNEAMTKAQETTQNVISATANEIAAHGYNPLAFEVGLKTVEARIPAFKAQADIMRQEALKNGPDWIKEQVQGWQKQSDLKTAAEIPEVTAKAELAQKVTAGTSPTGMTANQQAEEAARQVAAKQGAQRIGLEAQRLSQEDVAPTLTPDAKALAAKQFAMTGQLPPMGIGKSGAKVRADIINAAAETYKNLDLPSQVAAYKANQTSLTAMQKQRDAVGSFESTALKNLDQFMGTAQKIVDTGSPLINKPIRELSGSLLGSPEMAAYNTARQVVIPEFAKILSNPSLSGQLTDNARKEVQDVLGPNATLKQIIEVAKVLKTDAGNRRQALDDQIAAIQQRIATPPGGSTTTNQKDPMGIR